MRKRMLNGAAAWAVIVAGAVALGQPVWTTLDTIEVRAAQADLVVKGVITEVTLKTEMPIKPSPNYWPERVSATVTVQVTDVWKGKAGEKVVFVTDGRSGGELLTQWQRSGDPLIWFLRKNEAGVAGQPAAPEWVMRDVTWPIQLSGRRATGVKLRKPVLTMDFQVLEDEAQAVAAIKAQVERDKGMRNDKSEGIDIPEALGNRVEKGMYFRATIVVDARTEMIAREWLKSPEKVFPDREPMMAKDDPERISVENSLEYSRFTVQARAIGILAQLKSEENIALLKPFLTSNASYVRSGDGVNRTRYYVLRDAAYKALVAWDVAVEMPLIDENEK